MALKNLKHEQFAQELMSGKTQKDAYQAAYPIASDNTAKVNGCQLVNREEVRKRCLEILSHTAGLTLTKQLENLEDLSKADKEIVLNKVLKSVKDNPTRLEATKTILRLYGLLTSGSHPQVDARSVTFNITGADITKLDDITKRLERLELRKDRISGKEKVT